MHGHEESKDMSVRWFATVTVLHHKAYSSGVIGNRSVFFTKGQATHYIILTSNEIIIGCSAYLSNYENKLHDVYITLKTWANKNLLK